VARPTKSCLTAIELSSNRVIRDFNFRRNSPAHAAGSEEGHVTISLGTTLNKKGINDIASIKSEIYTTIRWSQLAVWSYRQLR
jgi:hypothetical protein